MNFKEFLAKIKVNEYKDDSLDLSEEVLDSNAINLLVSTLASQTHIISLNLSDTAVNDDDIQKIVKLTHLKTLDLSGNRIKEKGIVALAASRIENLDLSNTGLIDQYLKAFENNQCLQELTLNNNSRLSSQGLIILKTTQIKTLRICNFLRKGDEIAQALAGKDAPFVELILIQNAMTDHGVKALSDNQSLKKLNLFSNKITFNGAQELVSKLTLRNLDLTNNSLNTKELDQIKEMVSKKFRLSTNSSSIFYTNLDQESNEINLIFEQISPVFAPLENNKPELLAHVILQLPKLFPKAYTLATELSKSDNQDTNPSGIIEVTH